MSSTNNLPRSECPECGRRCRTISGVCGPCQGIGVDNDGLRGGRWVTVGGIQRWKPWTDEECAERTRRALHSLPVDNRFRGTAHVRSRTADSQQEAPIERAA